MSGFILTNTSAIKSHTADSAKKAFKNKSYKLEEHEVKLGNHLLTYYEDFFKGNTKIYQNKKGDVFYYSGYFSYDNQTGIEALKALEKGLDKKLKLEDQEFHGNYMLVVFYNNELRITTDLFGTYGCYTNEEKTWFTSSFTAASYLNKRNGLNRFELFENILFGMEFGMETFINGVFLLDTTKIHNADNNESVQRKITTHPLENDYQKCLELNAETLLEEFRLYHKFYQSSITAALSGGFDSRLMLAAQLDSNIVPDLYTYGFDDDPDILVAKDICSHEHIKLYTSERDTATECNVVEAKQIIMQNFWDFDGNRQLFNGRFNLDSRLERASDHSMVLNGAGGEIYRDVWKWDFKKKPLYDLLASSYDTGELEIFGIDKVEFFKHMEEKVQRQISHFGYHDNVINRQDAEMIFPIYRSNFYYQGNNINNYFGTATLPYMSQSVILQSGSIPYQFKRSGRFEADLIKMISPRLAEYNSEYGFNFKNGPSVKAKLLEWAYAKLNPDIKSKVKAALGSSNKSAFKKSKGNNIYLSPQVAGQLINLENLRLMPAIPEISKIKNQQLLNRIYSLELMANHFLN